MGNRIVSDSTPSFTIVHIELSVLDYIPVQKEEDLEIIDTRSNNHLIE
jgi:hypothetical protein